MNSKQKLLTFTAIGTVFATAIATVALIGNKNLQELRAGSGESSKLSITNFAKTHLDSFSDMKGYFTLSGTTQLSGDSFVSTTGTYVGAYEQTDITFGSNSDDFYVEVVDPYAGGGVVGFAIDFWFEGPGTPDVDGSVVELEIKKYNSYQMTSYITRTEYVVFKSLEDEGTTYLYSSYLTEYLEESITIKSVKISYTC